MSCCPLWYCGCLLCLRNVAVVLSFLFSLVAFSSLSSLVALWVLKLLLPIAGIVLALSSCFPCLGMGGFQSRYWRIYGVWAKLVSIYRVFGRYSLIEQPLPWTGNPSGPTLLVLAKVPHVSFPVPITIPPDCHSLTVLQGVVPLLAPLDGYNIRLVPPQYAFE